MCHKIILDHKDYTDLLYSKIKNYETNYNYINNFRSSSNYIQGE